MDATTTLSPLWRSRHGGWIETTRVHRTTTITTLWVHQSRRWKAWVLLLAGCCHGALVRRTGLELWLVGSLLLLLLRHTIVPHLLLGTASIPGLLLLLLRWHPLTWNWLAGTGNLVAPYRRVAESSAAAAARTRLDFQMVVVAVAAAAVPVRHKSRHQCYLDSWAHSIAAAAAEVAMAFQRCLGPTAFLAP